VDRPPGLPGGRNLTRRFAGIRRRRVHFRIDAGRRTEHTVGFRQLSPSASARWPVGGALRSDIALRRRLRRYAIIGAG